MDWEGEGRRERGGDFEWVRDLNCIGWKKEERNSHEPKFCFVFIIIFFI